MKDIYKQIEKMRAQQEAEAGPFFAELSTPQTWLELLRWMVENPNEDFESQMLELAAMSTWALETAREQFSGEAPLIDPCELTFDRRFGPVDRPLRLTRTRRRR